MIKADAPLAPRRFNSHRRSKRPAPPRAKQIVEANRELLAKLPRLERMSGEEHETCWACTRWMEGTPELAHVHAHSQGGSNEAGNYYLLCSRCHDEQPDGCPRLIQDAWLVTHESYGDRDSRESATITAAIKWIEQEAGRSLEAAGFADLSDAGFARLTRLKKAAEEEVQSAGWTNERANRIWSFLLIPIWCLEGRQS